MDKITFFSLLYAIVAIIFMWYAGISTAIASYIGKKILHTARKIITVFCFLILPLIISAFTGKIYKYLHPEISVRDMKLTLRIIEDVIKNPQFYL